MMTIYTVGLSDSTEVKENTVDAEDEDELLDELKKRFLEALELYEEEEMGSDGDGRER